MGLDVRARTVASCALDAQTGEIIMNRMTPDHGEILTWILSLPSPVRVVYKAGPTGFGLARFLLAAGIDTVVAAPSKLQRPSGDRVKTDAKDALHLARLPKLGEVTGARVPSEDQETAFAVVPARRCHVTGVVGLKCHHRQLRGGMVLTLPYAHATSVHTLDFSALEIRIDRVGPHYTERMTQNCTASAGPGSEAKCYESVYPTQAKVQKSLQSVELRRFELLTSSMRTKRSTN